MPPFPFSESQSKNIGCCLKLATFLFVLTFSNKHTDTHSQFVSNWLLFKGIQLLNQVACVPSVNMLQPQKQKTNTQTHMTKQHIEPRKKPEFEGNKKSLHSMKYWLACCNPDIVNW